MSAPAAALLDLPPDSPHLGEALTHPSYANEVGENLDNQRLEFLGDAVLGLCTSEILFNRFPDAAEGTLTRLRAQIVNSERLADWGRSIGLPQELRLGRGASSAGLRDSTNVVADAVEACIAAAWLDVGMDAARSISGRIVEFVLSLETGIGTADPKSELQELGQSLGVGLPTYTVCASGGPAHERWFEVEVLLADGWTAKGRGRSKRAAERDAAHALLQRRDELCAALGHPIATEPEGPS